MNDHSPCSATASGTPAPPGVQPSALSLQPSAPQRSLDLKLDSDASGRTRPISCLANASFQLSRVRYDDPGEPALAVFTLPHLGGVLAGDRGELCCALGRDAAARVRRAVATQVLGMPEGTRSTHSTSSLVAAAGSNGWLSR
jgi:urease accessory protein UreH